MVTGLKHDIQGETGYRGNRIFVWWIIKFAQVRCGPKADLPLNLRQRLDHFACSVVYYYIECGSSKRCDYSVSHHVNDDPFWTM